MMMHSLGLMSGTSCDGVDVALIETNGDAEIRFITADTLAYNPSLRKELLHAAQTDIPLLALLDLQKRVTEHHAAAVRMLLAEHDSACNVDIVGFHGHTLRHDSPRRLTFQLGDASLLAESLDTPVVADFRRRDLAAGGEGAPLAPLYHQALLAEHPKPAAVLNLGGVANITFLGNRGEIVAGDTGPGCGLLDSWAESVVGKPCDLDGKLAEAGQIQHDRIADALKAPFFEKLLPKSADRFDFTGLIDLDGLSPEDGAATLCGFTAAAVRRAIEQLPALPKHLYASGGGAKHPRIMQQLVAELAPLRCEMGNVRQIGLRPDSMEAECFAWLAVRRLRNLPTSQPSTTGAARSTVGGMFTT